MFGDVRREAYVHRAGTHRQCQARAADRTADLQAGDHFAKAKAQYEVAINNAKELAEIAMKAQGEAVAVLSKCVMANIDDLKTMSKSA